MSSTIRITKQFTFEAGHALYGYDGKCKNVHGHSYKLYVTVIGEPCIDADSQKNGMVIDFGDLKKIVNKEIVGVYDHAFLLNKNSGVNYGPDTHQMFSNTIYVNYQPTCENMLIEIVNIMQEHISSDVELSKVSLRETRTSYAEWYATDNQ